MCIHCNKAECQRMAYCNFCHGVRCGLEVACPHCLQKEWQKEWNNQSNKNIRAKQEEKIEFIIKDLSNGWGDEWQKLDKNSNSIPEEKK